jgi:hypothetical protein
MHDTSAAAVYQDVNVQLKTLTIFFPNSYNVDWLYNDDFRESSSSLMLMKKIMYSTADLSARTPALSDRDKKEYPWARACAV